MKTTTVWVIDDEIELGELFIDTFSSEQVVIHHFNSAQAALIAIKNHAPDLFFIDYRMPQMDGDELGSRLPADIPKFLVTGEINPKVKTKFNKIISKPYSLSEIQSIISIKGVL